MNRKTQGMSALLGLGLMAALPVSAQVDAQDPVQEREPAGREVSREGQTSQEWQGRARDAWIDGKLEASFLINTALNNFNIDTRVEEGNVTLEGEVDSETEKDLAGEIARSIDGVAEVDNRLRVSGGGDVARAPEGDASLREEDEQPAFDEDNELSATRAGESEEDRSLSRGEDSADERDFSTRFYDLTTTARLKSSFALSDQLSARAIEIDTRDGVVTLEGEVASEQQRELAERLAADYDHVTRVENRLRVSGQTAATDSPA